MTKNFYRCSDEDLRKLSFQDNKYGYRCFQSKPAGNIDILLLGDSHAEHLLPGFAEEYKSKNVASFLQVPLMSVDSEKFKDAIHKIANDKAIGEIYISSLWEIKIVSSTEDPVGQLLRTFKVFADNGKSVILLDDIPTFSFDPEACKYGRKFTTSGANCATSLESQIVRKALYHSVLEKAVSGSKNVKFVPVMKYFCSETECSMVKNGALLYRDASHLTINGSRYLVRSLKRDGVL